MEELNKLYEKKGTLITTIEVAQAQLQEVNRKIVELLNITNVSKEKVKKEEAK